jgi:hypothetical protein
MVALAIRNLLCFQMNLNSHKNQWTNKKVGNWTKQNFFKGGSPNGQKTHEKMLTIPGHQRNANQNQTKIPPHSC